MPPTETGTGKKATNKKGEFGLGLGIQYLTGGVKNTVAFGTILPDSDEAPYTICSMTRYTGTDATHRQRVLTSSSRNWLHGHWQGDNGRVFNEEWQLEGRDGSSNWVTLCGAYGPEGESAKKWTAHFVLNKEDDFVFLPASKHMKSDGKKRPGSVGINQTENEKSEWGFSRLVVYNGNFSYAIQFTHQSCVLVPVLSFVAQLCGVRQCPSCHQFVISWRQSLPKAVNSGGDHAP